MESLFLFWGGPSMSLDKNFSGYFVPVVKWVEGDFLFLQPLYLIPVEVFTTGLLKRPEYKTVIAVVEAVGGRVESFRKDMPAISEGHPEGRKLPVTLAPERAVRIAESALVSEGREGWRALAGSSHVMAREKEMRSCWKIWIRSGENLVDSVTGKEFPAGEFLGLMLPRELD
jgi:hypothetical protein